MTPDARAYFATNQQITGIRKGQAIVFNNLHTRLLVNFYVKFNKPVNPVKIFSDFNKAEKWVKELMSDW